MDEPTPTTALPSAETEALTWRVRLADKAPAKRYVVLGCAVVAFLVGTYRYGPLIGIVGFAIILGATAEFWLGSQFRIDAEGASVRTGASTSRIKWAEVKRVVVTDEGMKLSPLADEGRLSPFRGVFLRFGSADRMQIERLVRTYCENDVRFVEGRAE